ncbi:MAG: patatin family protein [Propionibacteriaceae bacterium]|nr:patatin family protein [Propionibacteriaceae bacterium]
MESNVRDVALVFEGGGMRAAYSSGVVATLVQQGIFFDFVGGISAGSSCTANYLARDPARAKKSFVDIVADPQFANVRDWFGGRGYFNAPYIYERTGGPGQSLPFDFATFTANPATRRIGAFECDTGRGLYFGERDLDTLPKLMRRVRASSTLPIVMPPVLIDGKTYVDGALGPTGGFAIDAAREAGYSRFFVVLTQERSYKKQPSKTPWLFDIWFRKFPAVAESLNDRWRRYNATREELFDLEASGDAYLFVPERMTVGNSTTDIAELQATYDAGYAQAQREIPKWREFLGL